MRSKINKREENSNAVIWQMIMTILYSNQQQRTERDGDTETGCQKPALQQKTTDDYDLRHRLSIYFWNLLLPSQCYV